MPTKTYAYIRSHIPEEEFVPTSEGYRRFGSNEPVVHHNRLYLVLRTSGEYEDSEFDLHLEVDDFANGVFVNHGDFALIDISIPDKVVRSIIHVVERRKARLALTGYGRDEIISKFEEGELDAEIAIALSEQHEVLDTRLYFGDEIDSAI